MGFSIRKSKYNSSFRKQPTKISWNCLFGNPGINELNYKWIKERTDIIREDLMNAVYHPRRLAFHLKLGYDIFDDENV